MKKLHNKLREDFNNAFSQLDINWNRDDLFVELYQTTGKLAVDYGDEMFKIARNKPIETFTSISINDFVLQSIKSIQETKKNDKKVPDFALEPDLWKELRKGFENALRSLENENKIERLDTINYFGFKIKNK